MDNEIKIKNLLVISGWWSFLTPYHFLCLPPPKDLVPQTVVVVTL
jgi:hypothetical protein